MPAKRQVLEHLTREELLRLVDRHGVIVGDRRQKAHLVERLVEKAPALAELLADLSRDRLKEICRTLGVDDGGREKAALLARLGAAQPAVQASAAQGRGSHASAAVHRQAMAPARPSSAARSGQLAFADASFFVRRPAVPPVPPLHRRSPTPPTPVRSVPKPSKAQTTPPPSPRIDTRLPPDTQQPLTQSELESHLWEAANILRGSPVDRTDWKSYILPLLFFKRICDVWDEEHAAMLAEYGSDYADEHRFQVPEGCHWNVVRGASKNVGASIQNAMRGIESANDKHLYGVFGDAGWSNKERLPDELLKDLIEHFSALSLGNARVGSDVLGDAYEYLIKQFADATNKKAGEFYTPRSVVRLMVDILDPKEGETVYDPACGTGGMLLAAVAHVRERGGDPRTFFGKLYGQEKNLTTASVARMNLLLHGIEDFTVERGDTLRTPIFTDPSTGGLATFDVVIANPPFSLEQWGRDLWEADPFGRNFAGLPTDSNGDMAWVQHMVKSMATRTGRMAVVLPQGALFRGGVEAQIRQHLLKNDLVEAVIGLAPNLFYGTGLAACVLVLRQKKPTTRKGKVLIIDASTVFRKGRAQNFLEPQHGEQILGWVQGFADVEDRARVVSLAEIEKEGWTLNISRFVLPPIGADIPPLPEAVAAFKEALARCRQAEDELRRVMIEGGWLQ